MSKKKARDELWAKAKKKFRLSPKHVQMAREMGWNPKKLGSKTSNRSELWKAPLGQFIEECYEKRFGGKKGATGCKKEPVVKQKERESKPKAPFIKGMELCRIFFEEAVKPLLNDRFPSLVYSAGRLGSGSDVIGYDSHRSRDHDWGPRVTLFLSEDDCEKEGKKVVEVLREELPLEVRGYSTNFGRHDDGTSNMVPVEQRPINHGVTITTVERFCQSYLGFYPDGHVDELQWLQLAQQRLLTIERGSVFWDGLDVLQRLKSTLKWYPKDVWLFLMANQWRRIGQEEPFMGRCGEEGDELGSRIVASRLLIESMRLAFLQEKQYAPYYKWFGRAFADLPRAKELRGYVDGVWSAKKWSTRQKFFSKMYESLVRRHNELEVTEELRPKVSAFHSRPYLVIHGERIAEAIIARIASPKLKKINPYVGSIDQFVDSTDVLSNPSLWPLVCAVHKEAD